MASQGTEERTNWPLVALLYVLGLLAAGHFAKAAVTLDILKKIYPEAGAALPFAVSMTSVAGILFGATAGIVVARFGARRVLLVAIAAGVALAALQATLPAFGLFLGVRLVEGFVHLSIVVAAPTLIAASSSTAHRGAVMGLWGTFFGVGFALFSLVAGYVGTWVYVVHGAALAVVGLCIAPILPRGVGRGSTVAEGWVARHVAIYTSARRIAPALMFFWHALTFLALLTFLPKQLGEWSAPVLPLISLVGTFAAGAVSRRVRPDLLAIAAFAVAAGLILCFWAFDAWRLWIIVPMLLAFGAVPGAAFASVPQLNPDPADQARANGALAQMGNIGTALTIPVYTLALTAGFGGFTALSVAVSLMGIVVTALIFGRAMASAAAA